MIYRVKKFAGIFFSFFPFYVVYHEVVPPLPARILVKLKTVRVTKKKQMLHLLLCYRYYNVRVTTGITTR
jgi:hypothetical protein